MCYFHLKSASCSINIRHFLLILSFLGTLCTRVGITVSQDHAYIPTEDNLLYLVEDMVVPIKTEEAFPKDSPESWKDENGPITVLGSPIGFEPGELDFGAQPIGVPVLRKVRIHNLNAESSIQMLSVSGNTIHFHCSFFAAKVIPPLGNTTFDVVFLSREKKGPVENTLYVHTSAGSFRFNVKARGAGDPYGLGPMTGIKLPLNTTYNRTISLHNPGPEPIQVLEMISSGSNDLSLVSPDGEIERPENSWTIPPFTTKVLMLAKFFARKEKNYTAYIRIRTNATFYPGKFLYVPFEALVVENVGIFAPDPLLDFGTFVLGIKEEPVSKDCNVYSTSFKKAMQIHLRFEENLRPKYIAPHLPLASPYLTSVATFSFTPFKEGLFEGFIEISTLDKLYKVIWKYRALVLNGSLSYDKNSTSFYVGDESNQFLQRKFSLKNNFKVPVKITGLKKLYKSSHPSLQSFHPVVLSPYEKKDILVITYNMSKDIDKEDLIQESTIHILTDVYNLNVTFNIYDGKIQKYLPDSPSQEYLDFGSLGMAVTRDSAFILTNRNPVNVSILKMNSNCSGCSLECSEELWKKILAGESITFCLRIVTSENEGSVQAQIFIKTEYESLTIPLKYRVVRGSLTTVPEDLEFDPVFPGEKAELKLTVYSSFAQEMITSDVNTIPKDNSFTFQHGVLRGRNVIMSVEKSYIGKVIFDPAQECRMTQSCYVGFEMGSKLGQFWLSAFNTTTRMEIMEITEIIVKILRQRYIFSLNSQKTSTDFYYDDFISRNLPSLVNNVTLSLNTNQIRGFLFRAKTKMIWPFVVQEEKINFSYTQIGNSSVGYCNLKNPSSVYPLFVHLVTVPREESPFQILALESEEPIQGLPHSTQKNSKSFILPPSNSVRVKLLFRPTKVFAEADNLLVRNNLTGGEVVWLVGHGSKPSFRFDFWDTTSERVKGPIGTLEFKITEKDLKVCGQSGQLEHSYQALTVRNSFNAKNIGQVPIWILGFYIGEYPCEGNGFKVMDCKPFRLDPNSARDIDIAFTPDFTVSYVMQNLHINSTLNKELLNYTLRASIPASMLSVCAAVLPRPIWETWIYYILNIGLFLVFFGVLFAAIFEADCIWSFYDSSTTSSVSEVPKFEDVEDIEYPEDTNCKSEGLRHRRIYRRRSSNNKCTEEGNYRSTTGIKGHINSLLDMVVPRSKSKSPSKSPSIEEPKPPLPKLCAPSSINGYKNKKKKQRNINKKRLR
ncbi:transmembrane protein 131 isoform X1 [Lepeophtheirus salmonis]|nr:transmembrane protein 131-like isoform X1 [Lepeophtheirus salmonis]